MSITRLQAEVNPFFGVVGDADSDAWTRRMWRVHPLKCTRRPERLKTPEEIRGYRDILVREHLVKDAALLETGATQ